MTRYGIRPQGSHVRITYPQGGQSSGITVARHSGPMPTYKVWHHATGVTAWYPASWLTRTDDPDARELVRA